MNTALDWGRGLYAFRRFRLVGYRTNIHANPVGVSEGVIQHQPTEYLRGDFTGRRDPGAGIIPVQFYGKARRHEGARRGEYKGGILNTALVLWRGLYLFRGFRMVVNVFFPDVLSESFPVRSQPLAGCARERSLRGAKRVVLPYGNA